MKKTKPTKNNSSITSSFRVIGSHFEKGIVEPDELSATDIPELAIVGRSNVGKSSLINRLCNNKKLARTSATPGRTQQLNSFLVDLKAESGHKIALRLIDLPGFGYAKLSHSQRDQLQQLINAYLTKAKPADLVLLLNDCKRLPGQEELDIRDHCFENSIPALIVLTKCDRLKRNELTAQSKKISSAYGLEQGDILISGDSLPVDPIWQRIFLQMY